MATSNRNERVRFRYGICLNDKDCSKCKAKEVQQITARKEFVCEECGKPLRECPPPRSFWDKYGKLIIAAAIVVIAVIVAVCVMFIPSGKTEPESLGEDTIKVDSTKVDTTKVDTVKVEPVVQEPTTEPEPEKDPEPIVEPKPVTNPTYGTVNLGYGTYTGDLKNGKPHGHGIITYTKSTKIVNSKDFIANPGDTFEGDFRDGRISGGIGYWSHDGNQTAVKP
jgi:hypothetical protein